MKKEPLRCIKLDKGESASLRIRRGIQLKCDRGILWLTACGEDIILQSGEELSWNRAPARIAMLPLGTDASLQLLSPAKR